MAKGKYSELYDGDEVIGAVVRTKTNCKPVFVSVGNRCDLNDAINCVLNCATKFRIPEPTRLADIEVAKIKKSL
jgi:deoxyribonuclease V